MEKRKKMRKINKSFLLIVFFIVILQKITCEEKYVEQTFGYDYVTIVSNTLSYRNITGLRAGGYTYPEEITLSLKQTSASYLYGFDNSGNKKAIVLKNDSIIILYYLDEGWNEKNPFFIGINEKSHINILPYSDIRASSEFQENDKIYSSNLLNQCIIESPWVENDSEYGIGEYLEFSLSGMTSSEKKRESTGFFLLNGFISWKNPSLYEKNCRIKRLKIEDLLTKEYWYQEISDTPNPQYVDCKGHENHKIRVIIVDVYEGTKYKDTCISGVILVK